MVVTTATGAGLLEVYLGHGIWTAVTPFSYKQFPLDFPAGYPNLTWGWPESAVVCSQLGFKHARPWSNNSCVMLPSNPPSAVPLLIGQVQCQGTEAGLFDCSLFSLKDEPQLVWAYMYASWWIWPGLGGPCQAIYVECTNGERTCLGKEQLGF